MKRRKVATKVWNKLFPIKVGNRVHIISSKTLLPYESPFLDYKGTVREIVSYFIQTPKRKFTQYYVELDSLKGGTLTFSKEELERIEDKCKKKD